MPITPSDNDPRPSTRVDVKLAERSGWVLIAERDGQIVATECCTDWHRVERRRQSLTGRTVGRRVRVVACLAITAVITAASASAQEPAPALLSEPRLITRAVDFVTQLKGDETTASKDGFYPDVGHMITGAGWISLGPGYRQHLLADRAVIDVSTALSWRAYKVAQARFELPTLADDHLTLGSQLLWQDLTQVVYFGTGPDSSRTDETDYRLRTVNTVLYATMRSSRAVSLTGRIGWLPVLGLSSSTGPFDRDLPDTIRLFPDESGARTSRQPRFLHGDVSLVADTRDHPGHPSQGGLYRAAWVKFSDSDGGAFAFERYELEGAHFVSMFAGRSVLALHSWGAFSRTTQGREIPFYLLPGLGGHNTIRSYSNFRFHDRDLLMVNVESRWALLPHVDAVLFADAGNVAPRIADLNLARTAYGAGMRLHTGATTFARIDVAKGHEGWHFVFRLNDPLRMARLKRHTAAAPFVP